MTSKLGEFIEQEFRVLSEKLFKWLLAIFYAITTSNVGSTVLKDFSSLIQRPVRVNRQRKKVNMFKTCYSTNPDNMEVNVDNCNSVVEFEVSSSPALTRLTVLYYFPVVRSVKQYKGE